MATPETKTPPKTARKFGAARVECPVCKQRVYPMEAVNFEGQSYHKTCMKCSHCNKKISIKGLAVINGNLYCKPHFVELFKSGGGKYENFGGTENGSGGGGGDTCVKATVPKSPKRETAPSTKTAKAAPAATTPTTTPTPTTKKPVVGKLTSSVTSAASTVTSAASTVTSAASNVAHKAVPSFLKKKTDPSTDTKKSAATSTPSAAPGDGGILDTIHAKDLQALKKLIEADGLTCLFQKGNKGMTPIEYAFKNQSDECGRHMLQCLEEKVQC